VAHAIVFVLVPSIDDKERAARLLKGIVGKRLTYRRPDKITNKKQAASAS
jgi:hypothetical protein